MKLITSLALAHTKCHFSPASSMLVTQSYWNIEVGALHWTEDVDWPEMDGTRETMLPEADAEVLGLVETAHARWNLSGESRKVLKNAEWALRSIECAWNSWSNTINRMSGLKPGYWKTIGDFGVLSVFCFFVRGAMMLRNCIDRLLDGASSPKYVFLDWMLKVVVEVVADRRSEVGKEVKRGANCSFLVEKRLLYDRACSKRRLKLCHFCK